MAFLILETLKLFVMWDTLNLHLSNAYVATLQKLGMGNQVIGVIGLDLCWRLKSNLQFS